MPMDNGLVISARAARLDADLVSRFATCCKALGLPVYDRRRPADMPAAHLAFTELTRVAYDHCDAWTGLAAAGSPTIDVLAAVVRTADTSGVLQRRIELPSGALGFDYDTGLYLRFRATTTDDFRLAYAAALAIDGAFHDAAEVVSEI